MWNQQENLRGRSDHVSLTTSRTASSNAMSSGSESEYKTITLPDIANGVTLGSDLQHNLDAHAFVLHPKGFRYETHFLQKQTAETACNHVHRVPIFLHEPANISLVFTRFIYRIFSLSFASWRMLMCCSETRSLGRSWSIDQLTHLSCSDCFAFGTTPASCEGTLQVVLSVHALEL